MTHSTIQAQGQAGLQRLPRAIGKAMAP